MMTKQRLQHLATVPVLLIGLGSMLMGLAWIVVPEPWLLDKWANEILLQTSFDALFATPGNEFVAAYLKGLYSFFGLWIFSFGLLVVLYVRSAGFERRRVRNRLYLALALILAITYYLQFTFIPTSHFVWVSHSFLLSLALSYLASRRLAD